MNAIPSEVIDIIIDMDYTPIRAWREYRKLTQEEVAELMNIPHAKYLQYENALRLKKSVIQDAAAALGVTYEQLNI